MEYYYYIDSDNNQQGPVDASQLIYSGCTLDSFVRRVGSTDWQQAKDVQDLALLFSNHGKMNSMRNSSSSGALRHLLYSILWFAAAGLSIWALIWLFKNAKVIRIKVAGIIAPLYFAWYGIQELKEFFKRLLHP